MQDKEPTMFSIRTILFPTDFSEQADNAFPLACALARDHCACLIVLHVYPPPLGHGEVVARRQTNGFHKQMWNALHRYRPAGPDTCMEHRLAEGDEAAEILRNAEECCCELIVMGTHGRTGLRRLLMGSVAELVMRKARCPVLTVKTPLPQGVVTGDTRPHEGVESCKAHGLPADLAWAEKVEPR
jgi:nucleotide-binding universal stress UspA family protein